LKVKVNRPHFQSHPRPC